MLGRAALLGILLVATACTDQVLFNDQSDAASPSTPDGSDATGAPTSDAACISKPFKLHPTARAAQMLILLDRSQSMQYAFYGTATTRADAAQSVLLDTIDNYEAKVKFGFGQFPADSYDKAFADCQRGMCCAGPVDVPPQLNNYTAIKGPLQCSEPASYPCPTTSSDSPSNAALKQVLDYHKRECRSGSTSDDCGDDHYVLLVLASEPSCSTSDGGDACTSAIDTAYELGRLGVRVVVLSVGYQTGAGSCLVRIANAGSSLSPPSGMKTLYTPPSVSDLKASVGEVVSAVARTGCTLDLDDVPPAQAQLWVSLGTSSSGSSVNPDSNNGWSYANTARTAITLSGAACEQYLRSSNIEVGYTCSICGSWNSCQW